ncbi:MAG: lipase family alpha/beta hydrolase, partial [Bacteroidota bacterium]
MDEKKWKQTTALIALLAIAGCAAPQSLQLSSLSSLSSLSPSSLSALKAVTRSQEFNVTRTVKAENWAKIECLSNLDPSFPDEQARPNGRQTDPEIVEGFGTQTPPSRDVLLHYGKGWEKGRGTPVLLVHGTLVDANSSWVKPHGKSGLAPALFEKGLRVFAVTLAHRHGDNLLQAENIKNAIERIKEVTGAKEVDVVAHSKGTVASRALASGLKKSWASAYRKDIRRLVLIAGPHLGMDYTFRHPAVNWGLYPEKAQSILNAPMSWTKTLFMGLWIDTSAQTLYSGHGDYFPGQSQLLYRWDKTYPLPMDGPDWYTSYHGGQGLVSYCPGIDQAIKDGGNFIDTLRKNPLDSKVQLAVLAGDNPNLSTILNETSGPSDGVAFVK